MHTDPPPDRTETASTTPSSTWRPDVQAQGALVRVAPARHARARPGNAALCGAVVAGDHEVTAGTWTSSGRWWTCSVATPRSPPTCAC